MAAFEQRATCYASQYSAFIATDVNEHVDGVMTLAENIADNNGLEQAYRAYGEWTRKNGREQELPAMGLTNEQVFFLSYAQVCVCVCVRERE